MRFKPVFHAGVTAVFGGLGLCQSLAHAQDLSIQVAGQISQSTCALVMKDQDGALINGSTADLQLGTYAPSLSNGVSQGIGATIIESRRTVNFFAKNADLTTDCTLTNNSFWDLSMNLNANQITSVFGFPALKNSIASTDGGTDVAVYLRGGLSGGTTQPLSYKAGASDNFVSGSTTVPNTPTSSGLQLEATMVLTTNALPTVGLFKASVPVTLVYK